MTRFIGFIVFALAALIILRYLGVDGRLPITDYNIGYNKAVVDAETCKARGPFATGAAYIGMNLRIGKLDDTKSDEWNAGYRQGWDDEIKK